MNPQGQRQGTCVHLGNCDIGCDVRAKNTLDLNYIPWAEKHGAEFRPLHLVRSLRPDGNGYRVGYDRIAEGRLVPGEAEADAVVLAAGSLGSTEILLRARDEHRTLPRVSPRLGLGWSANANVLTPDHYPREQGVRQGVGPTISAGLNFLDGPGGTPRYYVEDDGFPNVVLNALRAKLGSRPFSPLGRALARHLARGTNEANPMGGVMVWLGEGFDAGDGRLALRRRWLAPWGRKLDLRWDVTRSLPVIEAILAEHRRLSEAAGGRLQVPASWTWLRSLVTVHPLGGCATGRSAADGVVDHRGEVFGHSNLFVADGAVLPGPVGRNPSMTIAALAERTGALMAGGASRA